MAWAIEGKYYGPSLSNAFAPEPARAAAKKMARTGTDRLHDLIVEFTPVRTGNLRSSWYTTGTISAELAGREGHYVGRVKTDVDYAPDVNYGTGLWGPEHRKYLIEPHAPNKFLSWIDPATGRRVFARRVWHPGSEGAHMIEKAAAVLEGMSDPALEEDLRDFKRAMEDQMIEAQAGAK